MTNMKTSLKSMTLLNEDIYYVTDLLQDRGFRYADQIMDLRIFDLLNIYRINAEIAKETILMLYRFYNPNTSVDESMDDMLLDQYYPFADWRRKHPDPAEVTVRELVMAEDINRRAIAQIYNRIRKAFFRSEEYNSRQYRFWSYQDMLSERSMGNEKE